MYFQLVPHPSGRALPLQGLSLLDLQRIRSALERSKSANTRRAYDQAWRRWVAWSRARGARAMPATPELAATIPRKGQGQRQGRAVGSEASWSAQRRGRVDVALMSVLRDGLLRRSEAAELRWGDVEFQEDGSALLTVRRSKTDPEAEGVVLYIGRDTAQALQAIRPAEELLDPSTPVFGLTTRHIGNRVRAAAKAASLGEGYTGHSGRVGIAQDLAKNGVELPALMTAGRWKSSKLPARYTERQAADRGAVARYYQESGS